MVKSLYRRCILAGTFPALPTPRGSRVTVLASSISLFTHSLFHCSVVVWVAYISVVMRLVPGSIPIAIAFFFFKLFFDFGGSRSCSIQLATFTIAV
jgi:hypothetical protein